MKRDNQGNPVQVTHRWNRPPLSCVPCREKKRRCDRAQPCSNCVLRDIACNYVGQSAETLGPSGASQASTVSSDRATGLQPANSAESNNGNMDEMILHRIRKLEEIIERPGVSPQVDVKRQGIFSSSTPTSEPAFGSHYITPFNSHPPADSISYNHSEYPSIVDLTRKLPPLREAKSLFDNFATTLQPTFGILHIPSARILMERTYQCFLEGEEPPVADLMLLFAVFAGAALVWTPQLLEKLNATQWEAKSAFMAYARRALAILDHPRQILQSSTTALLATGTMAHLLMNTDGFPLKVLVLRNRCLLMSRDLGIHRLDTAKAREERRLKGCDMIEVEVQRRLWWSMVASDWLLSFSGGPQEGAYTLQPKHMNVNLPSNTDDEFITSTEVKQNLPLSVPTSMSAFFFRVKTSEVCREVIDALPSILLDSQEPEYDTILQLDRRFHDLIDNLPVFFKLDQESIEQSRTICKERPYIAVQRLAVHFSIHTRLCRLHRPYHLEGVTNPKYAYSHAMCIRSAHTVLELRRAMDEVDSKIGWKPARFWTVMHHVFFAAVILAMDVSFNPEAPDAEARKAKVLAAYETLERSKQESMHLMEGIQKNLQTLMSTLHKQRSQVTGPALNDPAQEALPTSQPVRGLGGSQAVHEGESSAVVQPSSTIIGDSALGFGLINDIGEEGWEHLWSEFVAVAPDLDAPQWNALLDDVDFTSRLDVY